MCGTFNETLRQEILALGSYQQKRVRADLDVGAERERDVWRVCRVLSHKTCLGVSGDSAHWRVYFAPHVPYTFSGRPGV